MSKKVKQVKVFREVKSTGNSVKETLSMVQELDRNSHVIKEVHYSEDEEEQVTKSVYNEAGQLISEEVHYLVDDMHEKLDLEYNAAGKRVKETKSYNGEVQEMVIREYDDKNNLIATKLVDADGETEESEAFTYNEQGKTNTYKKFNSGNSLFMTAELSYAPDGEIMEENRWSEETGNVKVVYDTVLKGKLPDSTSFNKDGKIIYRIRHSYDEKEQLVKEVMESTVGGLQKWTNLYTYNEQGKVTEMKVLDKSEAMRKQTKYVYNEQDELVAEVLFEEIPNSSPVQVKLSYEYEYYED